MSAVSPLQGQQADRGAEERGGEVGSAAPPKGRVGYRPAPARQESLLTEDRHPPPRAASSLPKKATLSGACRSSASDYG